MKTELKAKYLQHLLKKNKNKNEGFTLIELLVVIIIIGILAAIALPSMLNQANKARESGARSQIGSINRAQQAYRLENTVFAASTTLLGLGDPNTQDYKVEISGAPTSTEAVSKGTPRDTGSNMKTFTGTVTQTGGVTTSTITAST